MRVRVIASKPCYCYLKWLKNQSVVTRPRNRSTGGIVSSLHSWNPISIWPKCQKRHGISDSEVTVDTCKTCVYAVTLCCLSQYLQTTIWPKHHKTCKWWTWSTAVVEAWKVHLLPSPIAVLSLLCCLCQDVCSLHASVIQPQNNNEIILYPDHSDYLQAVLMKLTNNDNAKTGGVFYNSKQ